MIEVKNLRKEFDGEIVLDNINASFQNGMVNMIIGKSGSGKTVLLKCLVGLLSPTSGEIRYDGKNFVGLKSKEVRRLRRDIGMLFQGAALFDSRTVLENVMFPLDMFSRKNRRERKKRAEFCLERVNLLEAANLYPSEISGGMKKRAAIARAIALNPKYLFCDEPNSGLDPKTSQLIDELIHDLTKDFSMTTVVVSHDMNSVINIGDKVIFINEGVKEWEGNKSEVMGTDNEKLNDFVFASDLFKKIKEAEEEKG
ncbi:phospholipid/cholesterol/gamma-HCH transport system ATP-binding protein [Porphyromonadaceae bacterium NLAE-zl-C104]|jgi:phospholipid/cholesterol/gamma-HCH transport system ATP-binding protein|uniref:ABC transporter ATP-binding protein n=1 Tax=Proteiniphilum sp. TaxID=1926877 RepID=UPI000895A85E|nr:ATP-binding cassette domain-containing protein [Proteiniphilum sp.]MDY9919059.1 ATP-binding cassette domain-containing protein [Proteiniphilum sp.]SEA30765.1 phospholipid/cholesterol/gamma-HCH transport system ATP-binding protein [Porphyromonadaceae bacterium KH3R12]SFS69638.1 phospholipid/cholesterol/gamma-HCH transport system ATP-binding protein [Porphyromonadaceae bacterium NLAE-zl-C104]